MRQLSCIYQWYLYHECHFSPLPFLSQLRVPTVCQEASVIWLDSLQIPAQPISIPSLCSQALLDVPNIPNLSGEAQASDKRRDSGHNDWERGPSPQDQILGQNFPFLGPDRLESCSSEGSTQRSHSYIILQAGTAPTATRERHLSLSFPPTPRMSLIRQYLLSAATVISAMEV